MNDHLIQPFELRISGIFFFQRGFEFELKSCYYWVQMKKNRRAKKMLWTSKNRQARK